MKLFPFYVRREDNRRTWTKRIASSALKNQQRTLDAKWSASKFKTTLIQWKVRQVLWRVAVLRIPRWESRNNRSTIDKRQNDSIRRDSSVCRGATTHWYRYDLLQTVFSVVSLNKYFLLRHLISYQMPRNVTWRSSFSVGAYLCHAVSKIFPTWTVYVTYRLQSPKWTTEAYPFLSLGCERNVFDRFVNLTATKTLTSIEPSARDYR